MKIFYPLALLLFTFFHVSAQTITNVQKLNELAAEFSAEWQAQQVKVARYALDHNIPIRQETADGNLMELVDVRDGKPVFYITENLGAAKTTRVFPLWEGGTSGFELSGEGYDQLGEWDGGSVRATHQEFTDQGASRVTQMDGTSATHYHATHVAGTMVAAGINASAKGMLYGGNLKAWTWSNDESEMAAAAAQGLEISNHSYGAGAGWENNNGNWVWLGNSSISPTEDYKFGFYDYDARAMDQIAYNAPNYLIVRSAGNERGEGPSNAGQNGNPEIDGGTDGYDCIQPEKLAKNVMTVGAALEVEEYNGPGDVAISSFSSFGPADDGRVKPDIVGKGVSTFSTMDGNDTDYSTLSGTSMAAPNVAGSMALLQSYYQSISGGVPMRSATLRGLVLHTADEAGPHEGPDYIFGWGLMNAERAAMHIAEDEVQNVMEELVLQGGDVYMRDVVVAESSDLRVTVCWTDPPAMPVSPALNPRTPMLVNDLDLRIMDENSNIYYPYSLNPDSPSLAATTLGKNGVDNVEMVLITDAEPGVYTIFIDHDGSLENDEQAFSIIVSGINEYTVAPECSAGLTSPEDGAEDILLNEWIEWAPASFATSYDVYFGTDGGGTETPTNIFNGENVTGPGFNHLLAPATTYYLQIVPRNSYGVAEGCDQIYSFTTMDAISFYPHIETFESADVPEMAFGWQSLDISDGIWQSTDLIGMNDDHSMFCTNPAGFVETDFNNWLISPPFAVETGKEYNVSYFYKGLFPATAEALSLYWGYSPFIEDMTNPLWMDEEVLGPEWREAIALIVPEDEGVIFLGWHLNSQAGKAILLDDVEVEDWGTVDVQPGSIANGFKVYSHQSRVYIRADESWNGATIQIINLMGQRVYEGTYDGTSQVDLRGSHKGVYIVNLLNGSNMISKKVMLN